MGIARHAGRETPSNSPGGLKPPVDPRACAQDTMPGAGAPPSVSGRTARPADTMTAEAGMHDGGENVDNWTAVWTPVPLGWGGGVLLAGEVRAVWIRRHEPTAEHHCRWLGLSGPPGTATACFGGDSAELRGRVAGIAAMELREGAASVARLCPLGRGSHR